MGDKSTSIVSKEVVIEEVKGLDLFVLEKLRECFYVWKIGDENPYYVSYLSELMFDLKPDSLVQDYTSLWLDRIHPADRERVKNEFVELKKGHSVETVYRWQKSEDEVLWIQELRSIETSNEGTPVVCSMLMDITKAKEVEEKQKEALRRTDEILSNAKDYIVMVDLEGEIVYVNPAIEKASGEDLIGRNAFELLSPRYRKIYDEEVLPQVKANGYWESQGREMLPGYPEISISYVLVGHKSDTGEMEYLSIIARDISELEVKKQQLDRSLNEKKALLKEVFHRVKNNFQVISSLLFLETQKITDKKALEVLESAQNRIYSMALVNNLLYEQETFDAIDLHQYLTKIVDHSASAYQGDTHSRFTLLSQCSDVFVSPDLALNYGLIVNELMINTMKEGFRAKEEIRGTALLCLLGGRLWFVYYDSGPFYSVKEDDPLKGGEIKGLGLNLIDLLSEKVGATKYFGPFPELRASSDGCFDKLKPSLRDIMLKTAGDRRVYALSLDYERDANCEA